MRAALLVAAIAGLAAATTAAQEASLRLPEYLKPMPGSRVGRPYRVIVNGEASVFLNAEVGRPLEQVLEHYRAACRGRSALADLPEEVQRERELTDGMSIQRAPGWAMLGFVDRDGHTAGVVLFADPDPAARQTQYYLSWSEGKSPMPEVDPERDAPGNDPGDVPRPPGLRRTFSMERQDAGRSSTHVYEGMVDPAAVAAAYRSGLKERGWAEDPDVAEEFPAGNLQLFTRESWACQVMVSQDLPSGLVHVTVVVNPR